MQVRVLQVALNHNPMSNYIINTQNKQLTFLDGRFYRTEDGQFVPSVTTILDAYPKDAGYYMWLKSVGQDADTIRDEAGRRGTTVHEMTEAYDAGAEVSLLTEDGHLGYKVSEWAMFERYVEFIHRFKPEIMMTEHNFVNPELGWAGTIDRVIKIGSPNPVTMLLDIKTSNAIYPTYWLQLAAYRRLLEEAGIYVDQVGILWLNAKTRTNGKAGDIQGDGWQLLRKMACDTDEDLNLFVHTRALWMAQNHSAKPKQATYKLTHQKF